MVVFLCLLIFVMGYFWGGFFVVLRFFEAGVDICASLLKNAP